MIAAVDIGNSSINIGYFEGNELIVQKINTHPARSLPEYVDILNAFMAQNRIEKKHFSGIISSVVATHTNILKAALEGLTGKDVVVVDCRMDLGISLKVKSPEELGTDRIVNAVAAHELYGAPVAVMDFGTATTLTIVDGSQNLTGGSILPGIGLLNESLERRTSKLKKIALTAPEAALGRDTSECIRSGLFYGTAGAVERILSEIEEETTGRFKTIITGGYALFMDKLIKRHHKLNMDLTLEGLKIIYEKNRI